MKQNHPPCYRFHCLLIFLCFYNTGILTSAATLIVGNNGSDAGINGNSILATIQFAVNHANQTGGRVLLRTGTHSGGANCTAENPLDRKCNYNVDLVGKALIIEGEGQDPNQVIIDCEVTSWSLLATPGGAGPRRAFVFQSGETTATVLRGLTIKRCRALQGIQKSYCQSRVATGTPFPHPLNRGLFPRIPAHLGGGIAIASNSFPLLENLIIETCMAGVGGGLAVTGNGSSVTLRRVTIKNSNAASGGGISFENWGPLNHTRRIEWQEGILDGNAIDSTLGIYENCVEAKSHGQQTTPGHIVQRFGDKLGAGGFGHGVVGDREFLFLSARDDGLTVYVKNAQVLNDKYLEIQKLPTHYMGTKVKSYTIDDELYVVAIHSHVHEGTEAAPGYSGRQKRQIFKLEATDATEATLTHAAFSRPLVAGETIAVTGITGAPNVAMNQVYVVKATPSKTTTVVNGTGMTMGSYDSVGRSGTIAGRLAEADGVCNNGVEKLRTKFKTPFYNDIWRYNSVSDRDGFVFAATAVLFYSFTRCPTSAVSCMIIVFIVFCI